MQNHKKKLLQMCLTLISDHHLTRTEEETLEHKDVCFSPLSLEGSTASKTVVRGSLCPK